MDFFRAQDAARSRTRSLMFLFALTVAAIVAGVYLLAHVTIGPGIGAALDRKLLGVVAAVTLTVVLGGTIYRTTQLRRGGGRRVAEMFGGRRLSPSTKDEDERRLLNVVEEMALASGTPVPGVYLLDGEHAINAFAAGYTMDDAVIAVTRGALRGLSRDELQGVIGHEYSHVLNGDMRLNIQLMGALYGILLITIMGRMLLYGGRARGRVGAGRAKGSVQAAAAGAGLMAIGHIGALLARFIQSSVSRQREFLADAAAVQFTRNPAGVAGALRKIATMHGSVVLNPHAAEAGHFFFANGIMAALTPVFPTHPPLADRIRRIDPTLVPTPVDEERRRKEARERAEARGIRYTADQEDTPVAVKTRAPAYGPPAAKAQALLQTAVLGLVATVGDPKAENVAAAARLLEELPAGVRDAAHDASGAQALLFALLLHHDVPMNAQREALVAHGGDALAARAAELRSAVAPLGPRARLPLVDVLLPALRELGDAERAAVQGTAERMIRADGRINMFELAVGHVLRRQLSGGNGRPRTDPRVTVYSLEPVRDAAIAVLSAVARSGSQDEAAVASAFAAGASLLSAGGAVALVGRDALGVSALDSALGRLHTAAPAVRRRFMQACAATVAHDGRIEVQELELLRAVGEAVECPVPLS